MEATPSFASIVAKLTVLLDRALGVFVTVESEPISEGSSIVRFTSANVTDTGEAFADNIAQLLFNYVSFLSEYYAGLLTGVTV